MAARSSELNLLPKEAWEKGILGQLLTWVISVGRYVVIFTELVVISAFLYRFGLDRSLTDLQQSIKNKQTAIAGFNDLETDFRLVQTKLTAVKSVSDQPLVFNTLNSLSQMTPGDAVFNTVTINQENVVIEGTVGSQIGLATLLNQAQAQTRFSDVVLENVKSATEKTGAIEFRLILTFSQSPT